MAIMSDHQESVHRTYDRTWEDIESMLEKAERKMNEWITFYHYCRKENDRDGMKEAARNKKALEGVIKTLKWTLGEKGIKDPLN
jgi:hypothetical protein